ncbi:LysR family transcriptional regulator [Fusobacterium sp.]|uniref:LysR family transcriptional regulator n=1 Tax=Fusobacterium sp. TaxID=68766 RepID=UPI0029048E4D|nr:LysR family transcriptional regulator [Fusobacterium sp.]MDU1910094.1 LysR family transcriptional regulator [Fusobacterium sp.]
MDLREQEYVTVLAKYGNITRAAEALYVSQPTLSIFIKRLEERMGIKLFQYVGKKMILTPAGELYVKRAKELLIIQNQFLGELTDLITGYIGKIRVGIHLRRTRFFIPKLLVEFEKKYPNIEVIFIETKSEKMEAMLLDGELDIIFTNKVTAVDKVNVISVYKDKLLLAISPDNPACQYSTKIKGHEYPWLDLNHVKNNRFILQAAEQATRAFTNKALLFSRVIPEKIFIIKNMETASQLAAEKYGVAFTMASYARFFSYSKPIKFFEVGSPEFFVDICIAYRKNFYLTAYAREFISLIKKFFL